MNKCRTKRFDKWCIIGLFESNPNGPLPNEIGVLATSEKAHYMQ